jgi:L-lactate dehydrogenase complex protein LldG
MSDAREQILNTLRRGLQRGPVAGERRAELEARLAHPPRNVIPARALRPHFEQVDLFVRMARNAAATVDPVTHPADVPVAVSAFLDCEGLPAELVMAPDSELAALPWSEEPTLHIERRAAVDGDQTSVSLAFAGIAETGTLMLVSGPETPSTLNFLPETHVVVIRTEEIVGGYEDGWARLREKLGAMPRTVNFITGPSRSGDIEQTLQLGAHGPRRLHVVLVDDGAAGGERS